MGVSVAPDGSYYIATHGNVNFSGRVRRVSRPFPRDAGGAGIIPSADGSQAYEFDDAGRHLRTRDGLTGAVLLQLRLRRRRPAHLDHGRRRQRHDRRAQRRGADRARRAGRPADGARGWTPTAGSTASQGREPGDDDGVHAERADDEPDRPARRRAQLRARRRRPADARRGPRDRSADAQPDRVRETATTVTRTTALGRVSDVLGAAPRRGRAAARDDRAERRDDDRGVQAGRLAGHHLRRRCAGRAPDRARSALGLPVPILVSMQVTTPGGRTESTTHSSQATLATAGRSVQRPDPRRHDDHQRQDDHEPSYDALDPAGSPAPARRGGSGRPCSTPAAGSCASSPGAGLDPLVFTYDASGLTSGATQGARVVDVRARRRAGGSSRAPTRWAGGPSSTTTTPTA